MENSYNKSYITAITIVATLGGLLFGYDTAVISGTTFALEAFFVRPLFDDPVAATNVIIEYKFIVMLCFVIVMALAVSFLKKLFGSKGYLYAALIGVVAIIVGYMNFISLPNELTNTMASSIKGFTISSALVGCIIGGAIAGRVSETLGRKNGLIVSAVLFTISAVGSAIPDVLNFLSVEMVSSLIMYRIIGGVGVGMASMLSPMYIAEIAPPSERGKLVSYNQFAIIFGMLIVYFVNYFIARSGDDTWLNTTGWRYMFASEVIPCITFLVLLLFVPKSPRFLVYKGEDVKAKGVLEKLYGKAEAAVEIVRIKDTLKVKNAPWLSFGGGIIIVGVLLSFFQQAVGINVVLYYAPEIFKTMGSQTDTSLLQTIIVGVINLSFTVVAILTVDKFGRKPLMIIGALGMAISMTTLGFLFYTNSMGMGALIAMLFYTASFAVSWGPVTWVLISEIFPNSIKGAMSLSVAIQWLSNLVVSWTFPIMNESEVLTKTFNHGFAYWIYAAMGIVAALFIWKLVPETKGKSLESIEKLWIKK